MNTPIPQIENLALQMTDSEEDNDVGPIEFLAHETLEYVGEEIARLEFTVEQTQFLAFVFALGAHGALTTLQSGIDGYEEKGHITSFSLDDLIEDAEDLVGINDDEDDNDDEGYTV